MSDDFYSDNDWQGSDWPESWVPDTGDFVGGIVKRYDQAATEFRGERQAHPICVLEVELISGGADVSRGDEVGVWLLHTVLLSKFDEIRPRPGERIGIRKIPSPPDKQYHNYVVKVDRDVEDEEVPDFSAFQRNASDRGAAPDDPMKTWEDQEQAAGPGDPGGGPPPSGDDDLPF